jgi:hypothetical protein
MKLMGVIVYTAPGHLTLALHGVNMQADVLGIVTSKYETKQ